MQEISQVLDLDGEDISGMSNLIHYIIGITDTVCGIIIRSHVRLLFSFLLFLMFFIRASLDNIWLFCSDR